MIGFIQYFGGAYFGHRYWGHRYFDLPVPVQIGHRVFVLPAVRVVDVDAAPADAADPNRLVTVPAAVRLVTAEE